MRKGLALLAGAAVEVLEGYFRCKGYLLPGEAWGLNPRLDSPAQSTRVGKMHPCYTWL